MVDASVKLDSELKKEIEEYLSKGKNRIEFPSVKNFVDKAVLKYLREVRNERKK
ncbi:hypothetical protein HN789_07670 [archaeon]|jgi:hypothetical protein|nr:hypothetical protein [archaeon]MBT4022855.1 hypothetical protein [archaeon]MBT4272951.1 hypothetical protein [archaeon]MBT4460958.1 hypothetical protein [archaeon]MBT4858015.1 hypothetical protein [archaeon]